MLLRAEEGFWGLIDPSSLHKAYLSYAYCWHKDVHIPCDSNKKKKNVSDSVKIKIDE